MENSSKLYGLCLIGIATIANPSVAQFLIAADNFDRADGSLTDSIPTPGPGSIWTSHSGIAGDLLISSGQAVVQHGVPSNDTHIIFTSQDTGVLSAMFNITVSASAVISGTDFEYFAHFMSDGAFNYRSRLDIVPPTTGGDYSLGIASGSTTAEAIFPTDFTFGVTYTVKLEFDFNSGLGSLTVGETTIFGIGVYPAETLDSFALRQADSSLNETILIDNLEIYAATEPPEPTIQSISTNYPVIGDTLTISGRYFTNSLSLAIGGEQASFSVIDDLTIEAIVPDGNYGPVVITTPLGSSTSSENLLIVSSDTFFHVEENFDVQDTLGLFTAFSVTSSLDWTWDSANGDGYVFMDGFDGTGAEPASEDWLVSPAIDLSSSSGSGLHFRAKLRRFGPDPDVLISTDYDGSSFPNNSTFSWTLLSGITLTEDWTDSGVIDLTEFEGQTVYLAFRYTSASSMSFDSRIFSITQILVGSNLVESENRNLLANGGFGEDIAPSSPSGWSSYSSGATVVVSSDYAHRGANSLMIDNTGADAWTSPLLVQVVAASEGETFNFSGYMLTATAIPSTSFGLLKIVFKDAQGVELDPAQVSIGEFSTLFPGAEARPTLNSSSAPRTWIFTEAEATAPTGTVSADFYVLNVNAPDSADRMYFDSLAVTSSLPRIPGVVTLSNLQQTYDGDSHEVLATTDPAGLPIFITYDGFSTPPVNAGEYQVVATITDPSYFGSAHRTLVVEKELAAVTISNLEQVYDGTGKSASVTTDPEFLPISVTYEGSPDLPIEVGSYAVEAVVTSPNYAGSANATITIVASPQVIQVAAGGGHSLFLKRDGTVWETGDNKLGEVANVSQSIPVQVSGLTDVVAVGGGFSHSLFLKSDGTVWATGANEYGQLGNGSTAETLIPVQVLGLTDVVAVAGGYAHCLFLKSDGTVWATGWNEYGQLGDGSTADKSIPVQVSGLSDVIALAGGSYHSLFLKSDGTVWATGWNANGQLGDGTLVDKLTPVQVLGLSNVTSVAAGEAHSVYLEGDGTVWATGWNAYGQLGDGTLVDKLTPVQVSGLINGVVVGTGIIHSLFLKSDGTVWTTGGNEWGQLGDGTFVDKSIPVQVSGLSNVAAVSAGGAHNLFFESNGRVWATGNNKFGQLGDGTLVNKSTPVQVLGLGSYVATVNLANLSKIYDGTGQEVTVTTSPADLSVIVTYNDSSDLPIEAGSYVVEAVVTDPNYIGSSTGTLLIEKASQTISFNGATATYGDSEFTLSATSSSGLPVSYELGSATDVISLSGESISVLNAGEASVISSQAGSSNYLPADPVTAPVVVGKARATVTLSDLEHVYDGSEKTVSVTTDPAGLNVDVSVVSPLVTPINVGNYLMQGVVNERNYSGFAGATLEILPATATVSIDTLQQTYDGSARAVGVTTDPANLEISVTYNGSATAPFNAGSYDVAVTVTDPNYTGSASGTLVVDQAVATVTLSNLEQTYDGSGKSASVTTDPLSLPVSVTYNDSSDLPIEAGSYVVEAVVTDPNYIGSSTGTLLIEKASQTISFNGATATYGDSEFTLSATSSSGLPVSYELGSATDVISLSGESISVLNAGEASVISSQAGNSNYLPADPVTAPVVVGKARATVTLSDLEHVYDGSEKTVSVTTDPAGLNVDVSVVSPLVTPINVGNYLMQGVVNERNYSGFAGATLEILPATATVSIDTLQQTYDGSARAVGVTTDPANLEISVTYNGSATAPFNAGSYDVAVTVTDPNYTGSASGTLVVDQAVATVTLSNLEQTYDGSGKSASVTTDPLSLPVSVTYNDSSDLPIEAGSYVVEAVVMDPNYIGSASDTLVIVPPPDTTPPAIFLTSNPKVTNSGVLQATVETDETLGADPSVYLKEANQTTHPLSLILSGEQYYEFSLTTGTLGEGSYDLVVEAIDVPGNFASTKSKFVIDRTNPSLTIPVPPELLPLGPLEIQFQSSESLLSDPSVILADNSGTQTAGTLLSRSGNTYRYNLNILESMPEGAGTIQISGADLAGNSASSNFPVYLDVLAPELEVSYPSIVGWTAFEVVVTPGEILPVIPVLSITDSAGGNLLIQPPRTGGGVYTFDVTAQAGNVEGEGTVEVQIRDLSGNITSFSGLINLDLTPPVVTLTFDPDPPIGSGSVGLNLSVNEGLFTAPVVEAFLGPDLSVPVIPVSSTGTTFDYAISSDSLAFLSYTVTDLAGNTTAETVSFVDPAVQSNELNLTGSPGLGNDVEASLFVQNLGSSRVADVPLLFYSGSISLENLLWSTSLSLDPGEVTEITVLWPAASQGDDPYLLAVIDPENVVPELDEDNNLSTRTPLGITFLEASSVYLLSDSSAAPVFQVSTGYYQKRTVGDSEINTTSRLLDGTGAEVLVLETQYDAISESYRIPLEIGLNGLLPGDYSLEVEATGDMYPPESASVEFAIIEDFNASLSTDAVVYQRQGHVGISGAVLSASGAPVANAVVKIQIQARFGTRILTTYTDASGNFLYHYAPSKYEAGHYTVSVSADQKGIIRSSGTTGFEIHGLYAKESGSSITVFTGRTGEYNQSIHNLGESAITGLTWTLEQISGDTLSGVSLDSSGTSSSLNAGESTNLKVTIPATQISGAAVYQLTVESAEGAIDTTLLTFDVRPMQPRVRFEPQRLERILNVDAVDSDVINVINSGWEDVINPVMENDRPNWVSLSTSDGKPLYLAGNKGIADEGFGSMTWYSLIGQIAGTNETFEIGRASSYKPKAAGELLLRVNENDADLADNAGKITTTIRKLGSGDVETVEVVSTNGWQATGIQVLKGEEISFVTEGAWRTDSVSTRDASGDGVAFYRIGWYPDEQAYLAAAGGPVDWNIQVKGDNLNTVTLPVRSWLVYDVAGELELQVTDTLGRGLPDIPVEIYSSVYDPDLRKFPVYKAVTDFSGMVYFDSLQPGEYTYFVRKDGYFNESGTVRVNSGERVLVSQLLRRNFVTVEWEVNETTITDKYDVILRTTYDVVETPPILVVGDIRHTIKPDHSLTSSFVIRNLGDREAINLVVRASDFFLNPEAAELVFQVQEGGTISEVPQVTIDSLLPGETSQPISYRIQAGSFDQFGKTAEGSLTVDYDYLEGDVFNSDRAYGNVAITVDIVEKLQVNPPVIFKTVYPDLFEPEEIITEVGTLQVSNPSFNTMYFDLGEAKGLLVSKGIGLTDIIFKLFTGPFAVLLELGDFGLAVVDGEWDFMGGDARLFPGESASLTVNRSMEVYLFGILPKAFNWDFVSISSGALAFIGAPQYYDDIWDTIYTVPITIISITRLPGLTELTWNSPTLSGGGGGSSGGGGGSGGGGSFSSVGGATVPVVSEDKFVTFDIHQEITMERQAFEATLKINNGSDLESMENVRVDVTVLDAEGNVLCSDHRSCSEFFFADPTLSGVSEIDGTGSIDSGTSGVSEWLIIPTVSSGGKSYRMKAIIYFTVDGAPQIIETYEDVIHVDPQPFLQLDYYMQESFEAGEVFYLGLVARNVGDGPVQDLNIVSHPPKIVKEEDGLVLTTYDGAVVEFVQLDANGEVEDLGMQGDLLTTLGDIPAGEARTAWWALRADPGGRVTYFGAKEVSHDAELGGDLTSLIDVNTHIGGIEQLGLVEHGRAPVAMAAAASDSILPTGKYVLVDSSNDGSPDSLLELANGNSQPVEYFGELSPQITNSSELAVSVPETDGWFAARLLDPYTGNRLLLEVLREDGSAVPEENFWLRDGSIHLVDSLGGDYSMNFSPERELTPAIGILSLGSEILSGLGSSLDVFVTDMDQDLHPGSGNDHVSVQVITAQDPVGESITLSEVEPGVFTGQVNFSSNAVADDGRVAVAHNSRIDVSYEDFTTPEGAPATRNAFSIWTDPGYPAIIGDPTSMEVLQYTGAFLEVRATGASPLTFRWYRNGTLVPGAFSSVLSFSSVHPGEGGDYVAVVSNSSGTVESSIASLVVVADSDADGLSDQDESGIYGTNPLDEDSDGDGIPDDEELFVYLTDPNLKDTDDDGFNDATELNNGSDARSDSVVPSDEAVISDVMEALVSAEAGGHYQLYRSTNLANWKLVLDRISQTNEQLRHFSTYGVRSNDRFFYKASLLDSLETPDLTLDIKRALTFPARNGSLYYAVESWDSALWTLVEGPVEGIGDVSVFRLPPNNESILQYRVVDEFEFAALRFLSDSLVYETGFESDASGEAPDGWIFNPSWGDVGTIRIVESPVFNGLFSLRVQGQPYSTQGVFYPGSYSGEDTLLEFYVYCPSGALPGQPLGGVGFGGSYLSFLGGEDNSIQLFLPNSAGDPVYLEGLFANLWYRIRVRYDIDNTTLRVNVGTTESATVQFTLLETGGYNSDLSLNGNNRSSSESPNTIYVDEIKLYNAEYDFPYEEAP